VKHAERSEQAGENHVRFNPADLNSWAYWIRGKESVDDAPFEEGRVHAAIETRRSAVALAIVQPEIETYRGEQKHGAKGLSFQAVGFPYKSCPGLRAPGLRITSQIFSARAREGRPGGPFVANTAAGATKRVTGEFALVPQRIMTET
jgi:hypothetical protein